MDGNFYTQQVLDYLKEHDGITSMQAITLFGDTRLSSTIFQLKRAGNKIVTDKVKVKNRNGRTTTIAKYRLVRDE